MKRTLIYNARIVNDGQTFRGSVVTEGDLIAEVLKEDERPALPCDSEIDAGGCYLLPGVIDDHVHFRDPGLTHKAEMATETAAAAAGGVTSFMDMPNCKPQTTTIEALNDKFEYAASKCLVNYSFYFGATNDNADLLPLVDKKHVCGIKLFMGASTGNMLVDRMDTLRKIFSEAGMLIATHCEDQNIISENTAKYKAQYGEDLDISFHPLIRNEEACLRSSSLAIQLAKETGARLHILHISTAKELELLEDKPLEEKRITAEACVSHLMFCDEDYASFGARIKCNPAIKTVNDRDALRKALSDGRITTIGTDHAPHLLADKEGGCAKAASGMPMIQFSLVAMLELVDEGVLTIERLVELMCHNPARLFSVSKRGFIKKGYKADIAIVKAGEPWTVTPETIQSKCGWSPMEEHSFRWRVVSTICNGRMIYDNGTFDGESRGELRHD